MASAGDKIQIKHVFMAIIVIVSTLSFVASIVMITIGYLNPFGTVGLGILGGGCVLWFSAVLFLCAGSIWVKNRYYADENDFGEKWSQSSNEDISLLKPPANVISPATIEAGYIEKTESQSDNIVPLWSVSEVYSSVSSSVSTVPDKTVLWQGGDAEGALDFDVFSSSLTTMQHTEMKLQEKLKLKQGLTEQINPETSSNCNIKDVKKKLMADSPIIQSIGKSVSDIPRQRKPMVMDSLGTSYSNAEKKQIMIHPINVQSKEGNIHTQMCNRNNMPVMSYPMEDPPSSAAQSKHHQHMAEQIKQSYEGKERNEFTKNYTKEYKPALEKRKVHTGEKDSQTPDRHWNVISGEESWIHNPRAQLSTCNLPTAISKTEKKHESCEKLHKISHEKTEIPLQNRLPNTWIDQSEKLQLSSQTTTTEHLNSKGKFMTKAEARKGF
ncbi:hypothetical protein GDO81_013894 [Engystomops pustulosus]|uniref:Uncharacterized protein n=1 Tax=Engystomops pustulosus TaxID=76066 RepID=A0AAV7B6I3_ENGPU|nr:hypothetical protein GDO81_013894 [Engystomops pustulosus]